jgi:hypothetical protein
MGPIYGSEYLISCILYLTDAYIVLKQYIYRLFIKILVTWVGYRNLRRNRPSTILQARCLYDINDINDIIRLYYMFDQTQSCASMYRWLRNFQVQTRYVEIIYVKGNTIYAAKIDLDEDREVLSGSILSDGDISLEKLGGLVIYPPSSLTLISKPVM